MNSSEIVIALTGNPNSGKSTLFNALTGLRQKVGNYPGITVEKRTGICNLDSNLNNLKWPGWRILKFPKINTRSSFI